MKQRIAISTALVVSLSISAAVHAADTKNSSGVTIKQAAASKGPVSKSEAKAAQKGQITEAKALDLVKNQPEVKAFFKNVGKSKLATPTIDVDRKEGNEYIVHVYEVVSDGPDSSHTATMNWYHVDIKTGKIKKEF
ncbi:MAG: hypothetical protein C0507_04565 [Cyanobacteria bacterium PR.3.49]|nr:hypothetical protein [Cyanobacteria bacterium PR.3.49]